jgi:hypothetical protein
MNEDMEYYEATEAAAKARPSLSEIIARLHKRHPGTRRQRSYHGVNRYSVQFFDRTTGELVAYYDHL